MIHFPLLSVILPANTGLLFDELMKIAAFDFIETTPFLERLLSLGQTEPVNQNFEALGFESLYVLQNLGSLFLAYVVYFCGLLLLLLTKCAKCKWCQTLREHLSKWLFYGGLINLIVESYMTVIICCLIHAKNMSWSSYGEITQSLATIFFFVLLLAFPIVESTYLVFVFDKLTEKDVQARHGAFYEELNLKKGRLVLVQPVWFLVRRFILGVTVVLLNEAPVVWQFQLVMLIVLVQMVLLVSLNLFDSPSKLHRELVNEVVVMLALYHIMCFSEFVPEVDTRFMLGFSLNMLVAIWLLASLGWVIFQ